MDHADWPQTTYAARWHMKLISCLQSTNKQALVAQWTVVILNPRFQLRQIGAF